MVIVWSKAFPAMSPLFSVAPLARERPDQANVLLLAVRCPPAPTWMAELLYGPPWTKVAPATFIVPLTVIPKSGVLVSTAATTAPAVTFRVAPGWTTNRPVAAVNTYRWLAVVAVPSGA